MRESGSMGSPMVKVKSPNLMEYSLMAPTTRAASMAMERCSSPTALTMREILRMAKEHFEENLPLPMVTSMKESSKITREMAKAPLQ